MLYFDYAAHTPADGEVIKLFSQVEREYIANPNSSHSLGKISSQKLDEKTTSLSNLLCVKTDEIIYTSGASEANNLAVKGLTSAYKNNGRHIISTFIEHPSVSASISFLQQQGYEVDLLQLNSDGRVDIEHLRELMRSDTVLVSVCYVDSELGTIQPIEEIAEVLKAYPNCHFHTDATQAVGKISVNFGLADCTVFAPHKYFGLNGIGVIIKKSDVILTPQIHGGSSTSIYRSGTPSLSHISALELATKNAIRDMDKNFETVSVLKKFMVNKFSELDFVDINTPHKSSPYIINISIRGIKAKDFVKSLSDKGVCVSVKSACSTLNTPSRTVLALTKDKNRAKSSFRISISQKTTKDQILALIHEICLTYEHLKTS